MPSMPSAVTAVVPVSAPMPVSAEAMFVTTVQMDAAADGVIRHAVTRNTPIAISRIRLITITVGGGAIVACAAVVWRGNASAKQKHADDCGDDQYLSGVHGVSPQKSFFAQFLCYSRQPMSNRSDVVDDSVPHELNRD